MASGNSRQRRKESRANAQMQVVPIPTQESEAIKAHKSEQMTVKSNQKIALSHRIRRATKWLGTLGTLIGIVTAFFSFFPHLTLSDPITIDPNKLLSKYMTISNDGILPVYNVRCELAPRKLLAQNGNGIIGDNDFRTRIQRTDCSIGTLAPGDGYTFSLEGTVDLPIAQTVEADFAVVISYVPIFPPVRMDRCTHFVLHTSMNGDKQWFRSPGNCALFPWLSSK